MKYLKMTLLTLLVFLFTGINSVQAFSFNFSGGDDYYPYGYGWNPYYRPYYRPWGYLHPPQLPYFDRSSMVRERQDLMDKNTDAMSRLVELLYGKYDFDRAEAIQLARKIELTSGAALTQNFHPGAVRSYDSRTTPAFWGNEETFKAHAQALKAAARELALELEKTPTVSEGAVLLPKARREYGDNEEKAAVSPAVWDKFNALSSTCEGCHTNFRGRRWW